MDFLYLDCVSGISGDMFAGALLGLLPGFDIAAALSPLALEGYRLDVSPSASGSISATDFDVVLTEEHDHGEAHGHHHRAYRDIRAMIGRSGLDAEVKELSLKIFGRLAEAEGTVHGVPADEVEFHEVGAVDSIVDIVSAAILLRQLKPGRVVCSPLPVGGGTVNTRHGVLPVPAPATLELLRAAGIPFVSGPVQTELVTPTGAAIVAEIVSSFGPMPPARVKKTGYGRGKKDIGRPNVLRALLCEDGPGQSGESVCVLETCIDDSTGEELGLCLEELLALGALDAYYTPVYMKKNRPAWLLTVLCREEDEETMARAVFAHTGAIGMRRRASRRIVMNRREGEIATRFGPVRYKECEYAGVKKCKPEYESVKSAAREHGAPFREVYEEAMHCLLRRD